MSYLFGSILTVPGSDLVINRIKPVFTLHTVDLYLAFSKHSAPALVRAWREAFERLRARGAVERIRRKWM
ncbi:hypothetical protein [uncultured Desulfobacter sp.]|uniref:hypothetical protein n=1 Tax=uncultured Desulfobacter sp. TaxID=240139 RepID=UPI00374934E2